jgi:hypothetical protein
MHIHVNVILKFRMHDTHDDFINDNVCLYMDA